MNLSDSAVLEITELSSKAERLAAGSSSERAQASVLLNRIQNIRQTGISSDEARSKYARELNARVNPQLEAFEKRYSAAFQKYIQSAGNDMEARDLIVGTGSSVGYTSGAPGGYFIPIEWEADVKEAISQYTDLLNPEVTDFSVNEGFSFRPGQISGFDLSTISASIVAEGAQQTAQAFPTVAGAVMKNNILFKITFGVSMEAEQDIDDLRSKLTRAMGVGFARAIGNQLVSSASFSNALAQAIAVPVVTTSTGVISLANILAIYFSVNRAYRNLPRCCWVCSDTVYQRLRSAVDSQGRPLIDIASDKEKMLGKEIYISNDLPNLGTANSTLYFGDFGHYRIRTSRPTLQRVVNSSLAGMDASRGECGYIGRMFADAAVFDPSGGTNPPIVSALITK